MAIITATVLNTVIDNCCGYYLELLSTIGTGYGYGPQSGSWGAAQKATNIASAISGSGDLMLQSQIANPVVTLETIAAAVTRAGADLAPTLLAIQGNIIGAQVNQNVRSLDTYLTYLNTANPASYWAALQNPAWYLLGKAWFAGVTPSPWNVYADDPGSGNGTVYSNFLRELIIGTGQTAGDTIDSTKYAGGFPALVATGITGTDTVTVTGTARDPTNYTATISGVTWSVSVTGNGTFVLVPLTAPAHSLILAVSSIFAGAGLSAGTIQAVSQRPTGRPTEP